MFKIISELYTDDEQTVPCYGLKCNKHDIYVPAFTTSYFEAENACKLLNGADTSRDNLIYIIEDLAAERHLVYA